MGKVNTWYVIGKADEKCCFGYSQVTPKDNWFSTFEEAEYERIDLQKLTSDKLVVMKRTCEVLGN